VFIRGKKTATKHPWQTSRLRVRQTLCKSPAPVRRSNAEVQCSGWKARAT
jgi:hypothetical protein